MLHHAEFAFIFRCLSGGKTSIGPEYHFTQKSRTIIDNGFKCLWKRMKVSFHLETDPGRLYLK